ncbi:SemiSWEET family transporter [Patescibacteria group bacterium]|nr:SemiSWEET family transporter [Patescibacteria group bacterium]
MHIAYHHIVRRKRQMGRQKKSRLRFDLKAVMDKLVYATALFGVCANIPQLTKIWVDKTVAGVSIITWFGFLLGSLFWLCYGIVHREKPIIVTNGLYVAVQFFIVLGLLLQHVPFTVF